MPIYQPYTYLIGWSNHNIWYYGLRFARGCQPDDLWKKYFTSSKLVKSYRKKHGEPDVITVRKTFSCRTKAIDWEAKVLRRMKAVNRANWLNRSYLRQNHDKINYKTRNLTTFKTPEYRLKQSSATKLLYESNSVDLSYRQDTSYKENQSKKISNLYKQTNKAKDHRDRGGFQAKAICVCGTKFFSLSEAARAHNISVKAAYNRVKKDTWPDWSYVT